MSRASMINHSAHVRIARPSRDLAAAEAFYHEGVGLDVLYRVESEGAESNDLLMLGWPDADWHFELCRSEANPVEPQPTAEDLFVLYLDGPVPEELVERLERAGGKRVPAHNPYWDQWGVTVEDPDGYRLVLSTRSWGSAT